MTTMIDRVDNMTNPVITFFVGIGAMGLSWFSKHAEALAVVTLPAWMEWTQALGSWLAAVGGGLSACVSLYLIVRGRLLAKKGNRRKDD